jgi:hypothetical protein
MAKIDFIYECSDCGAEIKKTLTKPERRSYLQQEWTQSLTVTEVEIFANAPLNTSLHQSEIVAGKGWRFRDDLGLKKRPQRRGRTEAVRGTVLPGGGDGTVL